MASLSPKGHLLLPWRLFRYEFWGNTDIQTIRNASHSYQTLILGALNIPHTGRAPLQCDWLRTVRFFWP
jgi:hypothetical protein